MYTVVGFYGYTLSITLSCFELLHFSQSSNTIFFSNINFGSWNNLQKWELVIEHFVIFYLTQ